MFGWFFRKPPDRGACVVAPPNVLLSVWLVTVALRVAPLPVGAAAFVRGGRRVGPGGVALDELVRA